MNTAFFIFWTTWSLDYALYLELIERELALGHKVSIYYCDGSCLACSSCSSNTDFQICRFCNLNLHKTLSLLSLPVRLIPLSSIKVHTEFKMPEVNWDLASLFALNCEGYHYCRSVLSSIISMTRNPFPNWESQKKEIIPLFRDNLIVYRKVTKILQQQDIDKIFVYNGRLSYTRAVFDACMNLNKSVTTFDFGCDNNHFQLYENHLPHDIVYNQNLYKKLWQSAIREDRQLAIDTACKFFKKRRYKTRQEVKLFTLSQEDGRLPENFDDNQKNIVIFCSSEDEFIAVSEEWNHIWFLDQLDAISQLIKALEPEASAKKIKLYIRLHPNMRKQNKAYTQKYYTLANSYTEVIPCDSPVDSYCLMEKASKVIVFGSTVGVEAAFWKNPAILADIAFYQGMNIAQEVTNLHDLKEAIFTEKKFVPDMEMVYAYGYYYETGGYPYRYLSQENKKNIRFKDFIIDSPQFYMKNRWSWNTMMNKADILQRRIKRLLKYYFFEQFQYK